MRGWLRLLAGLPSRIPDLTERVFLEEALLCFRAGAFRASMVMTWNLAFHHFISWMAARHLATFNQRWPIRFPGHHKAQSRNIGKVEDFAAELKEFEVIDIAVSANIISPDVAKIMKGRLDQRNSAAHPSSVTMGRLQAEAFIDDLVNNVVLKLR